MEKQEVLELVGKYLEKARIKPIEDTLSYSGIREKAPQPDGTFRAMHVVTFSQEGIKDNPNTVYVTFVTVDVENSKYGTLTNKFTMERVDFSDKEDE